jgi:hypothetical protein
MKSTEDTVREQLRHEADQAPDAAWMRQRVMLHVAELETSAPRKGKTLLVVVAAAAAVLAIAGATIYTANVALSTDEPGPAVHGSTGHDNACIVDRVRSSSAWLNGNRTQQGVEAVGNILQSDYGSLDTLAGLRMGLIGTAIDDANKRLVVVIDPSIIDQQKLQGRLTAAAGNGLIVKVAAGCNSALELINARQTLTTEMQNANFDLSPYDSTWHVRLSPADRDLGRRLISRAGALVVVEYMANPGGARF